MLTGLFGLGVVELPRMTKPTHTGDPADPQAKNPDPPVVNLLDDKPTKEDLAGGGHKRVADAIARLIEREQGGKAIALEGTWGSGKSSVVQMLEEACCKDTLVYTFDAWKHEGDPLRIAFLRGLFQRLKETRTKAEHEAWIKPGQHGVWKQALDQFERGSGVTRNVHAALLRKKDLISIWALLTAPVVLAVGVAIFASDWPDTVRYIVASIALSFGFIVASVPLWSLRKAPSTFPSEGHEEDPSNKADPSVAQIMLTRQPAHVVTKFSGPPAVTSLSFERLFKTLVRRALQADNDRRLVIVIDNLDRLSVEDALKVWTTMRVFLEMERDDAPWLDRFWLVVPYDRTALAEIWNGDTTSPAQPTGTQATATGDDNEKKSPTIHHSRPSSFLDKTFAIRFDVPPLLLANWEKALARYLRKALGEDLSEATIKGVSVLSRRFASEQNHPPTPRHLKLFVNDIGALVRQHETVFPLDTLAAYAILRRALLSPEGIREDLRTERKNINKYLGVGWLDEERSAHLACLVFNTHDVELARELLLAEPIGKAIGAGNRQALEGLLSNPAAESVLENSIDVIFNAIGRDKASHVEDGFKVLGAVLDDAEGRKAESLRFLVSRLYPEKNILKYAHSPSILCYHIAKLAPNPISLARIVQHLDGIARDMPFQVSGAELAQCWANLWFHGGYDVHSDPSFREITLPSQEDLMLDFLMAIYEAPEANPTLWARLRTPAGLDLTKALLPAEDGELWTKHQLDALAVVSYMPFKSVDWDSVAEVMYQSIGVANADDDDITADLLRFMRGSDLPMPFHVSQLASDSMSIGKTGTTRRVPNARWAAYCGNQDSSFVKYRKALREQGKWLTLFATAADAERWHDAADFLVEHGLDNAITPNMTERHRLSSLYEVGPAFFDDPNTCPELLDAMAEIDPHWLKPFLQLQLKGQKSTLIAAAVMGRMEPEAIRECFHPAWVITNWAVLYKANLEAPGIVKNILDAHEVSDIKQPYAISRKFVADQELVTHVGPIRALVDHGAGESTFYEVLQQSLAKITSDFWTEEIARKGAWYALLLVLREKRSITLGTNYYRGLEGLATQLVQDPESVQKIEAQEARKLLDVVGNTHELTLAKALRDLATTTLKDNREHLYEVFGEPIREAMLADPKASDVPGIVILAANGSHGFEPGWLPGFLTDPRAPDVVMKAGQADRDSLLATVREKAAKEGDGGGPYTTFLRACQAAGLETQDTPGTPEEDTPA